MTTVSEAERLNVLHRLQVLHTAPEPQYDAICDIARDLFQVPAAVISLMDRHEQWFKARCGIALSGTSREEAFCRVTIETDEVFVVEDAWADPRFASNPYVRGEPHIRFYAGAPLIYGPGLRLGALCVVDHQPRSFSDTDRARLEKLATVVVAQLRLQEAHVQRENDRAELQAKQHQLGRQQRELRRRETMIAQTEHLAKIGTWELDLSTRRMTWSDNLYRMYGWPLGRIITGDDAAASFAPDDREQINTSIADVCREPGTFDLTLPLTDATGERRTLRIAGTAEIADGRARSVFGIAHDITDYVNAVSQAVEKNRLLLMAEQVAGIGHWHVQLPSERPTWSGEIYKIFGLDPANGPLLMEDVVELFHPDDRAAITDVLAKVRETGQDYEVEGRIIRPDGELRTILARGIHQKDETGVVRSYFGVTADITDRKRVEADLRESRNLLAATLENMDQGLLVVDAEDRVQVFNRRALELLGLPAEFMAGKPTQTQVREFQIAQGELADEPPEILRSIETGVEGDCPVFERERRNGTVLEVRAVPLPGGGAVRTYTDITARKRAEAARAETESRYRLLAEHASDLIILGYNDGRRAYISPAVETMLGYTVEEAYTLGMRDFVHPDDLEGVFATTRALSREAPHGSVLHRLRHKDGHFLWAESAFQWVEADGKVRIITAIRDVTERQRQAEELRIAKEAAEDEKARAEHANHAKTEFLASMSHEIRTPLNGILGYADLLITSAGLTPEQHRHVERIQSAGAALLTVVDDILDFSKIEAGKLVLEPAPFAPRELVEDAIAIVRSVADRKGLPLVVEMSPDVPAVLVGDEARLRQILLNLLNNAVKFTREGRVTLRVSHRGRAAGGENIAFQVADTGIGIPPDKQVRLFKRFSQVDGSINREFGGTGLGLAISKQLVDLMCGDMTVRSTPGHGSTFSFSVTLPKADRLTVELAKMIDPVPGQRSASILLVEDLDINQDLARAVLEAAGHRVHVVGDGAAAVEAVQRQAFDLILMDVQMPGMDGLTATRLIRALEGSARDIPIIAMTANVLPQQVTACRQAGMTDHIGKPFKRDELYAAVERALHGSPRHAADPETVLDAPVLDRAVLAALEEMGGPALVSRLLNQFADGFSARFLSETAPKDRETVARNAHAMVSSAGMLGLMRLSRACSDLEDVCNGAAPIDAPLERVRDLGEEAVRLARQWEPGS